MAVPDQLREVCRWNSRLAQENLQLRAALRCRDQECRRLTRTVAHLAARLAACEVLLGAAVDQRLEGR
jgi:hypothetical protein